MDEVLLDNMEQDLSVLDLEHTEDAANDISDIGQQVPGVITAASDTRRTGYQTSYFGGDVSSITSNQ